MAIRTHYVSRITQYAARFTFYVLRPVLPCLLVFALLVLTLDDQSLWWDEGISLHLATSSWAEIIADRAANIHPPLYFFALKLWVGLMGRTPFAARYLSALAATLLPAVTYTFVRRRVDWRTGRAAALLVALAPLFVIYGQEVRAYAFLPLLALALLAQVWPAQPHKRRAAYYRHMLAVDYNPLLLALIQAAFVLTHYAGVIAVAWANLVLLLYLIRCKDRRAWRPWLFSVGLTALFAAPWAVPVLLAGARGLNTQAGLGNVLAEPIPLAYLARLLGIFHTVGLPEAMANLLLARPSVLTGVLLLSALLWYSLHRLRGTRFGNRGYFLAVWLLPLLTAALMWVFSPQAHPRYVLPFVTGGWLLVAALTTARDVPRWLRASLLSAVLTTCLLGLHAYLTDPTYARSDVRGAAAYIRAEAVPGDVALAPYTDWSLEQYGVGAAQLITLPSPADDSAIATLLTAAPQPNSHVYLLDYRRNALDPRGQVRALLAWGGWLEARDEFHGVFVERYVLSTAPVSPGCMPIPAACVQGQSPCLTGIAFPSTSVSGAALPVILCWDGAPVPGRYAAALRLYAQSGALVTGTDTWLLDDALRTTELWSTGPVTTYHLVPLPAGMLPRAYRLEVGVYPVDDPAMPLSLMREAAPPVPALVLGDVTPILAPWVDDDLPVIEAITTLSALRLQRVTLHNDIVYPGQALYVTSRWQVMADDVSTAGLRLMLRQDNRELTSITLLDGMPLLPKGRPLLEHSALVVPPDAEDGTADVVVIAGNHQVVVGAMTVRVGEHTFVAPLATYPVSAQAGDVATLLGLDVEPGLTLHPGDPFTVTLIWRAETGGGSTDLTIFTHLIGEDGSIVAQHDGKPGNGLRPTGGWLTGEILVDPHTLAWQRDYTGPATLHLGLYDATTGVRVMWEADGDTFAFTELLEVGTP